MQPSPSLPLLFGCEASAAVDPSGPPIVRSLAPSAQPSAARNGVVSPQQQDVIDALKAYETAIVASDTVTLKQIWSEDDTFINPQGGLVTRAERLANLASASPTSSRV